MLSKPVAASRETQVRFEKTALPHMDLIYRIACRMARNNTHEAEDLMQETYLHAFRAFHQFRADSNCRAWLGRILSNANVDRVLRWIKRADRHQLNAADHPCPAHESGPSPAAPLDYAGHVNDDLKRAIDETPEVFRTPLLLSALGDKSYREISTILGCPVGTVMSRVFRARQHVRRRLQAQRSPHTVAAAAAAAPAPVAEARGRKDRKGARR